MEKVHTRNTRLELHILDTYFFLRLGVGLLALAFPILLWALSKVLVGVSLQESMSAYYHAGMRNVFVGVLFAIAFFLLLYKGFSRREDWALNIAAILAVVIAVFPMNIDWSIGCNLTCENSNEILQCLELSFKPFTAGKLHGACAILFFIAIGFVSICCSGESLYLVEDKQHRNYYRHTYRILGWAMVILPLVAWGLFTFAHLGEPGSKNYSIFFVELAGIWAFAAYWLLKTYELRETRGDKHFVPSEYRQNEEA